MLVIGSRKKYVWAKDEPATDASCDFGLGDAGYRDPQYGLHNVSYIFLSSVFNIINLFVCYISLQIARKAENSVGEMVYYEHYYVQVSWSLVYVKQTQQSR